MFSLYNFDCILLPKNRYSIFCSTSRDFFEILINRIDIKNSLNRLLILIFIPCTIFILVFLVAPLEAKALLSTVQIAPISNGIEIAYQFDDHTITAVNEFKEAVSSLDPDGNVFVDIRASEINGMVLVKVANGWHYQPYQIRKQVAQGLWKIWAAAYSPNNPDSARIKILDLSGNRVGGSSAFGGSLVDVDK
jgi:hypothetical protein